LNRSAIPGVRLRAEAARVVDAVISGGRSLDPTLRAAEEKLAPADRPLLHMLCFGTLRKHWLLKWQLSQLLERPLKARDSVIESLLLVGFFQLSDSRVPDHAVVSVSVEAARALKRPKLSGLINALLRNYRRRNIAELAPTNREALHNHPAWMLDALESDWPDHWQDVAAANNERAPMWLRVNARQFDAADYFKTLELPAEMHAPLPQAIRLDAPVPVSELPGFDVGAVSVQDAAAQLAAPWLLGNELEQDDAGPEAERRLPWRILDACAAPGNKTAHLLELCGPGDRLVAIDSDPDRLESLRANLARLKLPAEGLAENTRAATIVAGDASSTDDWWDGEPFDRILLDAPCSASGVIRRHPDIKHLRRASDLQELARRQRALLEALWPTLAPGGQLLYVTCSVFAAENDAVIGPFIAAHDDAEAGPVLHNYNRSDLMLSTSFGMQILPGTLGLDGFYFAPLSKHTL